MNLLTKDTDYATRALVVLATKKTEFTSAQKISQDQKIPYQFLRRILQTLIKNNLIESKEGKGGGVRIIKNPEEISIITLIKIFQDTTSKCMFRGKICPSSKTCVLKPEINRINKNINEEFKKLTIAKLLLKFKGGNK